MSKYPAKAGGTSACGGAIAGAAGRAATAVTGTEATVCNPSVELRTIGCKPIFRTIALRATGAALLSGAITASGSISTPETHN